MEGYRVLATENKNEVAELLKTEEKPSLVLIGARTSPDQFPDFDPLRITTLERPINIDRLLDTVSQIK